ncbi:MAG: hypothetical protein N2117_03455 [Anaerolineales bacterium]|nr:hypothetical protein [Anaerolineales bacterium]MCX7754289.1 hypothetical protein [Anaerolineales bacterium]MDW8278676.1 hypothetical protein [Anaerolineales bacterium]
MNLQKPSFFLALGLVLLALLSACGGNGDAREAQPSATLPPPQVRVGLLPTFTPEPATLTPVPEASGTPTPAPQVQAWPTLDEEQYLLNLIDSMIEKIERRLNNTNTDIRP